MTKHTAWSYFDNRLAAPAEDIEFRLLGLPALPWADFLLNPRRLRGSDFLMRWSQGAWSERRVVEAVNATGEFVAIPYGPSSVAPRRDLREHELYFERLEAAGRGSIKRPDLLIMRRADHDAVEAAVSRLGGVRELPFHDEEAAEMRRLLRLAIVAVECENSLWMARKMPDFGTPLRPMRRLGGLPGLPKNAVVPNFFLKEEDQDRLLNWERSASLPIHIWLVFHDLAYGISLQTADGLIESGHIDRQSWTYQSAGGSSQAKGVYRIYCHYAYPLGAVVEPPRFRANHLVDKNGHILPWVQFEGGRLDLSSEAIRELRRAERAGRPDEPA